MLESVQRQFCQNLLVRDQNIDFIASSEAADRFAIYQGTIKENLRHALELTFPGIWALLGPDCANGAAYLFIKHQDYLPTTGCLDDWGESFPAFLATLGELQHLAYLQDFAWLEWLKHKAYGVQDLSILSAHELQKMTGRISETSSFIFHPSVFFFSSIYPIDQIQALVSDPSQPNISLDAGGCYGIIARVQNRVTNYWLQQQDWQFLFYLSKGYNLQEAYEKIIEIYADFDLVKNLQFMMKNDIIHQIGGMDEHSET